MKFKKYIGTFILLIYYQNLDSTPFQAGYGIFDSSIFDNQAPSQILFTPSDGSKTQGTYYPYQKTATTSLYQYDNVVALTNTKNLNAPDQPQFNLNDQGKYIDAQGNILDQIGSYSLFDQNDTYTYFYYLFGHKHEKNNKQESKLKETFDSQGDL